MLRHEGDLSCPLGAREVSDVSTVREHRTARGVSQCEQQLDQCRLATAGWADDSDDLVFLDFEVDRMEHRRIGGVFERCIHELQPSDGADARSSVYHRCSLVSLEFIVERVEEGPCRIDGRRRRLQTLAVAE